jgi:hypothetical protein
VVKVDKTIKVSEETYREINELVGAMREKKGKPVSINEALSEVLRKEKKGDIMRFAGAWKMTDKEYKNVKFEVRRYRKAFDKSFKERVKRLGLDK